MRVKVFRAETFPEAQRMVRDALGDDALIVETREDANAFEILAVLEDQNFQDCAPLAMPRVSEAEFSERERMLRWHGAGDALIQRLMDGDLADRLSQNLRFGVIDPATEARPLLLAGEPGSGKSLTVAKLATRLVMAKRTPLVVSADGRKAGAVEQLASFTRLLGLDLIVADDPRTLKLALGRRRNLQPVLIDGPGLSIDVVSDAAELAELSGSVDAETVLVVPAGLDPAETVDVAAGHAEAGVRRMIVTRTDVAKRLGGILNASSETGIKLAAAGCGSSVADGLGELSAASLADQLSKRFAMTQPGALRRQDLHRSTTPAAYDGSEEVGRWH